VGHNGSVPDGSAGGGRLGVTGYGTGSPAGVRYGVLDVRTTQVSNGKPIHRRIARAARRAGTPFWIGPTASFICISTSRNARRSRRPVQASFGNTSATSLPSTALLRLDALAPQAHSDDRAPSAWTPGADPESHQLRNVRALRPLTSQAPLSGAFDNTVTSIRGQYPARSQNPF